MPQRSLPRSAYTRSLVLSNPFFRAEKDRFVKLAATTRLPAIYEYRGFVKSGGLMSYGSDLREVFGRLAILVDKILLQRADEVIQ